MKYKDKNTLRLRKQSMKTLKVLGQWSYKDKEFRKMICQLLLFPILTLFHFLKYNVVLPGTM